MKEFERIQINNRKDLRKWLQAKAAKQKIMRADNND